MPEEQDEGMTPSEKILALYSTLLFNDRAYSLEELATMLRTSKATVLRLINTLERHEGSRLRRGKKGKEAIYWLERREGIPPLSLDAEGLAQLALCRDFLCGLLPKGMLDGAHATLEKAATWLPRGTQALPPGVGTSISKGRIDYTPYEPLLETLLEAIRSAKVCAIAYYSAKKREVTRHEFAPKRLLAYRETLYLVGWYVEGSDPVRRRWDNPQLLPVQRFRECALTEKSSAHLPDVDPDTGALGIQQEEEFEARIWFAPGTATYVAERRWSDDQEVEELEDGSIILRAVMGSYDECVSWVLGFGAGARVLEPDWLVKDVKKALRMALRGYGASAPGEAGEPEADAREGEGGPEEGGAEH